MNVFVMFCEKVFSLLAFSLLALGISCGTSYAAFSPQESVVGIESSLEDVRFRTFLKKWDQDELVPHWAVKDWQESKDYGVQLRRAWALASWTEGKLKQKSFPDLKQEHPSLFSGPHVSTDSYRLMEVLVDRWTFKSAQKQWLDRQVLGTAAEASDSVAGAKNEKLFRAKHWMKLLVELRKKEPTIQVLFRYSNQENDLDLRSRIANLVSELDAMKAWCLLIHWDLEEAKKRQRENLESAVQLFQKSMGISAEELNPERLEVEFAGIHPKSRSNLLGLGMCFYWLGRWKEGNGCFQVLFDSYPAAEGNQLRAVQAICLARQNRWDEVRLLISRELVRLEQKPSMQEYFCKTVIQNLVSGDAEGSKKNEVVQFVFNSLVKQAKFSLVAKIAKHFNVSPDSQKLYGRLFRFDRLGGTRRFDSVTKAEQEEIRQNLDFFVKSDHPTLSKVLEIWCYYQLGILGGNQHPSVADTYLQKGVILSDPKSAFGKKIRWERIRWKFLSVEAERRSGKDPVEEAAELDRLCDQFIRQYAGTELAGVASVYQTLMKNSGDFRKTMESLKDWSVDQPGYLFARQHLLAVMHRRWINYFGKSGKRTQLEDQILIVCLDIQRFLAEGQSTVAKPANQGLRHNVRSIAADVIRKDGGSFEWRRRWLQEFETDFKELEKGRFTNQSATYYLKLLEIWSAEKRDDRVQLVARKLLNSPDSKPFREQVSAVLSESYSRQVDLVWDSNNKGVNLDARKELTKEAIEFFEQYWKFLGEKQDQEQSLRQQVYLAVKSGQWLLLLEEAKRAEKMLRWADSKFPGKNSIEFPLAVAISELGDSKNAVQAWQKVIPALKPGSMDWLRGKHYLITHLASIDKDSARKELRMVKALFPEMKEPYQGKFEKLYEQLGVSSGKDQGK